MYVVVCVCRFVALVREAYILNIVTVTFLGLGTKLGCEMLRDHVCSKSARDEVSSISTNIVRGGTP